MFFLFIGGNYESVFSFSSYELLFNYICKVVDLDSVNEKERKDNVLKLDNVSFYYNGGDVIDSKYVDKYKVDNGSYYLSINEVSEILYKYGE